MDRMSQAAKEWLELKAKAKEIEKRLLSLRLILEPVLTLSPDHTFEAHGFKFSLIETSRESFSLAKARKVIAEEDLTPFITKTVFTQLHTKALVPAEVIQYETQDVAAEMYRFGRK